MLNKINPVRPPARQCQALAGGSVSYGVKKQIIQEKLIQRGDAVILALSGGPDSVCLAHLLASLQKPLGFKIILAHLNHRMRGKESEEDAIFVKKFSCKLKLPLIIKKLSQKPRNENEARLARYQFLEKVRKENRAQSIATGHTLDDQVETILLHFLRGAGLRGLSGMQMRNNKIIRPLLIFERKEILAYLKKHKLTYRLDRTNLNPKIFRNKIRLKLLPLLAREYNPQIKKNLLNLACIAREAQDYLEKEARKFLGPEPLVLSLGTWQKLPPILKKETLRQALKHAAGSLEDIYSVHIEEIVRMLEGPRGNKKKHLPCGLLILKKDGKIFIASDPAPNAMRCRGAKQPPAIFY